MSMYEKIIKKLKFIYFFVLVVFSINIAEYTNWGHPKLCTDKNYRGRCLEMHPGTNPDILPTSTQ